MRPRCAMMLVIAACSASPPLAELTTAEKRAEAGDVDGAVDAYRAAQRECQRLQPLRRAQAACAEALLGEAETLEHADRIPQAIEAYLAIPGKTQRDHATDATATVRAAELFRRLGNARAATAALWRVITEWPKEVAATDAVRTYLELERGRDPTSLVAALVALLPTVEGTAVHDNVQWALADLEEHERNDLRAARAYLDAIYREHPDSGLRDDARWHAARLSRALGDTKGTIDRLRGLLATREVAFGAGSYFSIWLDDAQLELGKVLRDDAKDYAGAIAAFEKLPRDYPASILRDDALFELAVTHERAGAHDEACITLAKLKAQYPDSKFVKRSEVSCG